MVKDIILEGLRLGVIRSEQLIFRNINFTIRNGNNLLLTGKNGSGKSTLLKVISGLITPTEGKILLNKNPSLIKSYLHYLSDHEEFKPELSCLKNLMHFSYLLYPNQDNNYHLNNCLESMKVMNLYSLKDHPTKYLSFGQRKRLSLCRLLLSHATVWILDEPTVGLDKDSLKLLSDIISRHNYSGGLTIVSSHINLMLNNVSLIELD